MKRDKTESFLVVPLLCFIGLFFCWSAAWSDWNQPSAMAPMESEFSRAQPPPTAEMQGEVTRIEATALQAFVGHYSTNMSAQELERYYDSMLKKNGWLAREPSFASEKQVNLYCKGELDAVLDKTAAPGHYRFAVRRQQGSSFKTGCPVQTG